jgi:hypothetical protein
VGADAAAGYSADYYSQYSQYWTQVAAWQQYQQYYQAGYTQVRISQLLPVLRIRIRDPVPF